MKQISKGLYFGSIFGAGITAVLLFIMWAVMMDSYRTEGMGAILALLGAALYIFAIVMAMRLIYRLWDAIQGTHARSTPGKAVGFMFIPFFNIYWIFQAYWGWTVDCNKVMEHENIAGPRAMEGIALTACILTLVSVLPLIGILASLANIVLIIIFLNSSINSANAVLAHSQSGVSVPAQF